MKSDIFAVSGMKCVHCKANVENALKSLNGVKSAEANLEKANVNVEYDESVVTPAQLKEANNSCYRHGMFCMFCQCREETERA